MSDHQDKDLAAFDEWLAEQEVDPRWFQLTRYSQLRAAFIAGLAHGRAEAQLREIDPSDAELGAEGLALFRGGYLIPVKRRTWGWDQIPPGAQKRGLVVASETVAFYPCKVHEIAAALPEKAEPPRTLPDMLDAERGEGRDDWRATEEEIEDFANRADSSTERAVRWAESRAAKVIEGLRGEVQRAHAAVGASHVAEQGALINLVDEIHIREEWQEKAKAAEKRAEEAEAKLAEYEAAEKLNESMMEEIGKQHGKRVQELKAEHDELRTFKAALEEIQRKTRNLSDGSSHLIKMVCDKHGLSAEPSEDEAAFVPHLEVFRDPSGKPEAVYLALRDGKAQTATQPCEDKLIFHHVRRGEECEEVVGIKVLLPCESVAEPSTPPEPWTPKAGDRVILKSGEAGKVEFVEGRYASIDIDVDQGHTTKVVYVTDCERIEEAKEEGTTPEPAVELAAGQVWLSTMTARFIYKENDRLESASVNLDGSGGFRMRTGEEETRKTPSYCRLVAGPGSRAEEVK